MRTTIIILLVIACVTAFFVITAQESLPVQAANALQELGNARIERQLPATAYDTTQNHIIFLSDGWQNSKTDSIRFYNDTASFTDTVYTVILHQIFSRINLTRIQYLEVVIITRFEEIRLVDYYWNENIFTENMHDNVDVVFHFDQKLLPDEVSDYTRDRIERIYLGALKRAVHVANFQKGIVSSFTQAALSDMRKHDAQILNDLLSRDTTYITWIPNSWLTDEKIAEALLQNWDGRTGIPYTAASPTSFMMDGILSDSYTTLWAPSLQTLESLKGQKVLVLYKLDYSRGK